MEFRIVHIWEGYHNVPEPVYDVLINDFRHLLVRKSVYEKFVSGEYWLLKRDNEYYFDSKDGIVKRYSEVVL